MAAQRQAVETFAAGKRWTVAGSFAEVEKGARTDRPELARALDQCRRIGATLVIARLDRLARNAAFLLGLRDSGVDFVAVDCPSADRFTVGVLALIAEREAELISARTKAALAAAKRRGTVLGNPKLAQARIRAVQATRKRASEFTAKVGTVIYEIQRKGRVDSLREIAECLNARGVKTITGKAFTRRSVRRVLRSIGSRTHSLNSTVS